MIASPGRGWWGLCPWDRQPLRPARAGEDPQVDLGQADPRAARHHPVVAAHRDLEAAAERRPVDPRRRRHRRLLERPHHRTEARLQRRLAKLRDVRARRKGQPVAQDHHARRRVLDRALHARHQAAAHRRRQRVHGRRLHVQHGDAVAQGVAYGRHRFCCCVSRGWRSDGRPRDWRSDGRPREPPPTSRALREPEPA